MPLLGGERFSNRGTAREVGVQIDFAKVAPYLKDPLVLIGFFLFICFLFVRFLVKQRVIPPLPPTLGFRALKTILLYGLIIGLLLICLGFALKYNELKDRTRQAREELRSRERQAQIDRDNNERVRKQTEAELHKQQQNLVELLDREMNANLQVASELQKNSATLLNEFITMSTVVRTPGIKLLFVMFPKENLDLKYGDETAAKLADKAFETLIDTNLYKDQLEKQKLTAAAQAISATIDATTSTVRSLSDSSHHRYRFSSDVWNANLSVLRTVVISDLSPYQNSYSELNRLRNDYDVVTSRFQEYLGSLREFLDPAKHSIDVESLRKVLAQERFAYSLITSFAEALVKDSRGIRNLRSTLKGSGFQSSGKLALPYVFVSLHCLTYTGWFSAGAALTIVERTALPVSEHTHSARRVLRKFGVLQIRIEV